VECADECSHQGPEHTLLAEFGLPEQWQRWLARTLLVFLLVLSIPLLAVVAATHNDVVTLHEILVRSSSLSLLALKGA